ncbi:MAG: WYL domain-containing protein [Solirubrobacterales bacterium]
MRTAQILCARNGVWRVVGRAKKLPRGQELISFAQRRRLEAIELALYWTGEICRASVMRAFQVAKNHVTKDIGLYKEVAGGNVIYDVQRRRYRANKDFTPRFTSKAAADYLSILMLGASKSGLSEVPQVCAVPADALPLPPAAPLDAVLPVITRAISDQAGIQITYRSLNREGPNNRIVLPRALFQTGRAWAMRAFDVDADEYRDFIIARITHAEGADFLISEFDLDEDELWETIVEVSVVPGRGLSAGSAEVVADEYGMSGNPGRRVWKARMRAALIPYFLDHHGLRPGSDESAGIRLLSIANWEEVARYDRKSKVT